jgi:HD superfamily phosphodiesterase
MNKLDEGWVDSDVLYMAAWFHDVGKMEVYKMEGDAPKIDSDMERGLATRRYQTRCLLRLPKISV